MFIQKNKKSCPKIPTKERLRNIALYYLERFESSEKNLYDVLKRRVDKYAFFDKDYDPKPAYVWINEITEELVHKNFVDDKRFAYLKINSYLAAGKSKRYIQQKLAQKGVDKKIIAQYFDECEYSELDTALNFAKKKKIGCFRHNDDERLLNRKKDLTALVMAGFDYDTAQQVIDKECEDI